MKAQFVLDSSLRGGRNIATKTEGDKGDETVRYYGSVADLPEPARFL